MDPFFNNGSISSGWRSSLHGQLPRIHSRQIVAAMWRAGTTVQFSAISPSTRRLEDARAALKQSESCQKIQDRTYPFTDVDPFGFSILQHSICSRVPGGRCPTAVASGTAALALERPTCRTLVPVAAPAAKPPEIVGQNAVWARRLSVGRNRRSRPNGARRSAEARSSPNRFNLGKRSPTQASRLTALDVRFKSLLARRRSTGLWL